MYTCSNIVILTWVSMRTLFLLSAFKDVSKSCSNTSLLNHMYSFLLSIDVNYIVNANISGIQLMSGWYISFFYIHIISRLLQYSCMIRPGTYWQKCVLCNGWLCLTSFRKMWFIHCSDICPFSVGYPFDRKSYLPNTLFYFSNGFMKVEFQSRSEADKKHLCNHKKQLECANRSSSTVRVLLLLLVWK